MARWIKRGAAALLLLLALAVLTVWLLARGSLPRLRGAVAMNALLAPVAVQRDALGVVTIDAANERDAMRTLGYVHAQERYFEMDLLRRTAAGELAGLFGPRAVDVDKRRRVHRMRARVIHDLGAMPADQRGLLAAYVEGVNAGLAGLKVKPWPYLLLRAEPAKWQLADSPLVGYAMYFDLQDAGNARELGLAEIKPHLPAALYALLAHAGSSWDAPLYGAPIGDASLPDASQVDLRRLASPSASRYRSEAMGASDVGSNNFAVAGALTADGRAIVANDMHLGLRAPNIWFRARLRYADRGLANGRVDVSGFTLPGLPGVVVGSNGHVAWGFTNSYGDWLDWRYEPGCANGQAARAACAGLREYDETIAVKGAPAQVLRVRETPWGPLLHDRPGGAALSLRWSAHLPGSLNLGLTGLARAQSIDEALATADRIAMPVQNLLIADAGGRIGWRLLGPLPQRAPGCAGATVTRGPACAPWGIATDASPRLLDPAAGRLWTANARTLDGAALARVGDGGYAMGARARQIRDALFATSRFNERDLLAIQVDDRALFLQRWWQLLREPAPGPSARIELAQAAATWSGRAATDSVAYRITRAWRLAVHKRLVEGLTAPARVALGSEAPMPEFNQFEGVAWPLVTQRPAHLLPRRYASWDALFEDAAVEVRDELRQHGPLAQRSWGERNTAAICHPLAAALPGFARPALCMPAEPLAGDTAMPRVQGPDFGASERMVVSPGHEADGIIHMPGGQSGHPLSPYWGAGHDDWVRGRPTPFLPGATRYTLQITPGR